MTTLETLALALYRSVVGNPVATWDSMSEDERGAALRWARDGLTGILEPSRATMNAGAFYFIQHGGPAGEYEMSMARQAFRAMLNRILTS